MYVCVCERERACVRVCVLCVCLLCICVWVYMSEYILAGNGSGDEVGRLCVRGCVRVCVRARVCVRRCVCVFAYVYV